MRRVFDHIGGPGGGPAPPGPLWAAVLGRAAPFVDAVANGAPDPRADRVPAVLVADQSKASERVSWAWLCEVLRR